MFERFELEYDYMYDWLFISEESSKKEDKPVIEGETITSTQKNITSTNKG